MPIPTETAKFARVLARDEVYSTLRAWIVDGVLKPNENLSDLNISQTLGVSRTPVREALLRLEEEGLVVTALNRWTRVAPIEVEATQSVYTIIQTLDALSFDLAATRHDPRVWLDDLRRANEEMLAAALIEDSSAASKADEDFHGRWNRAANNSELQAIIGKLRVKVRRVELAYFNTIPRTLASHAEHLEIIRAIEIGDAGLAVTRIKNNWASSLERLSSDDGGSSMHSSEKAG